MATNTEQRERNAAIERGLDFIYRAGSKQKHFANYGAFMICCFALVGATARNERLRSIGRDRAKQLLRRWTQMHPVLPAAVSSDLLHEFVVVRYAQSRIGIRDSAGARAIKAAASKFSVTDLLGFEPAKEPPPHDLPYPCDCTFQNQRGRKICKKCHRRLHNRSRYRVWMEALANTYVAERSGIFFGARYADVLKWLPAMRPYPKAGEHDEETVRAAIYAVTHVVYTLNDYNTFKLSPHLLPQEFAYLKANVPDACARHDPELLGELLDSLQAFGLTAKDPLIQSGTQYLMREQNDDGSWGDLREENIRRRCHTTWTAIDGLRAYAWRGERLMRPDVKALLTG